MFKITCFKKQICIHYKGMIPYAAYYIVSGCLELSKKKGKMIELQSGEILGLEECWFNQSLNYNIYTKPGTILVYLDKTLLSNIKESMSTICT